MSDLPKKIGGMAIQTNPAPVADKADVRGVFDDLGRQLMRFQARDLISTAYLALANGTKTLLKAGVAGQFSDLYQITCANTSDAAITLTLLDESTEIMRLQLPANQVQSLYFQIPLLQSAAGVGWYVDMGDFTDTTVNINAMFSQEV